MLFKNLNNQLISGEYVDLGQKKSPGFTDPGFSGIINSYPGSGNDRVIGRFRFQPYSFRIKKTFSIKGTIDF